MKTKILLAMIVALSFGLPAFAEGDQCQQDCPSGEKLVSYLGGGDDNSPVDCHCVADDGSAMPNDNADYGDPDTAQHEYTGE